MRCKIFNCDKVHGHRCCADCKHRGKCANPCQNHPTRCGQAREDTLKEAARAAGVRTISAAEAAAIIENREPAGVFILRHGRERYVGIDNRTGNAWTEDFKTLKECLKWLVGAMPREECGP